MFFLCTCIKVWKYLKVPGYADHTLHTSLYFDSVLNLNYSTLLVFWIIRWWVWEWGGGVHITFYYILTKETVELDWLVGWWTVNRFNKSNPNLKPKLNLYYLDLILHLQRQVLIYLVSRYFCMSFTVGVMQVAYPIWVTYVWHMYNKCY